MTRKYQLDLLRVVACLFVVFYHYFYYGRLVGRLELQLLSFPLFNYGYLGVDIFFVISGFVIFNSLESHKLKGFFRARVQRLYPIYWLCLTFTLLFFVISDRKIEFINVLLNLTMLQSFFGVESLDGVYWTLAIEIVFYVLISLIYYFSPKKSFDFFSFIWLLGAYFSFFELIDFGILKSLLLLNWIPYFMLGIAIYRYIEKRGIIFFILIILSLKLCLLRTHSRSIALSLLDTANVTPIYSVYIFLAVIILLFLSLLFDWNFKTKPKLLMTLSLCTYPLYLLHQEIGYILISFIYTFSSENTTNYLTLFVILAMFYLAYLVVVIDKKIHLQGKKWKE